MTKIGENYKDSQPSPGASIYLAPAGGSTLFIHVPKTGGTTLCSILQDHYYNVPQLPHAAPADLGVYISKLNDPIYPFIGGHFPVSTICVERFEHKITVLRDPVDIISSAISFVHKVRNLPEDSLLQAEQEGAPICNFKIFFSLHFDTHRYKLDFDAGLADPFSQYISECTVIEAIEGLKKFTHVFDFSSLDGEIKRYIIERDFFPYSQISKKRRYAYLPDYERARKSLSEFDQSFYALGKEMFRELPKNIDSIYEQYRADYCREKGVELQIFEGKMLDLRAPIGIGWHSVDTSSHGTPFRWSEPSEATVEIPVRIAGTYAVVLFINPAKVSHLKIRAKTILSPRNFEVQLIHEKSMIVCQLFVVTRSHDWIHIDLTMEEEIATPCLAQTDVRELGLVLSGISISRQP